MAAANLQATVYGLRGCQDRALFVDHLRSIAVPAFEPRVRGIINAFSNWILASDATCEKFHNVFISCIICFLWLIVVCPLQEGVKIAVTDNELRNTGSQQRRGRLSSEDTDAADACEQILQELPTPATLVVSRRVPLRVVSINQRS